MSSSKFLDINPLKLQFPFELRKKVCCSLQLYNKTKEYVGFKIQQDKETCPDKYFAMPNKGVMLPGSTCHIIIKMQAQLQMPPDLLCEDKLLIKSISIHHTALAMTSKDIMIDMLMNVYCDHVDLDILNIVYVIPSQPSFPVSEISCGDSRTRVSASNNENTTATGLITPSNPANDLQENSSEVFGSLHWIKSLSNKKKGNVKKNPVIVSSEEDDDEESNAMENQVMVSSEEANEYWFDAYSDECYEIDHTSFTRKLTFDDTADVSLVAEKGPVALRDFPHPRHLCGCFPFETTSHEQFCNKCFCCVCEVASPCSQWNGINGHCHLTEKLLGGV